MKKIIALIVMIACIFTLFACGDPEVPNPDPTPDEGGNGDPTPDEGGDDPAPDEGGDDPAPDEGGDDPAPDEGGEKDPVADINKMYAVSCPTKIVSLVERKINDKQSGSRVYDSTTDMIIVGKVDGRDAAVRESSYETLASIEEGAETPIITKTTRVEYLEGKGIRRNGGAWDAEGKNFAPTNGSIAINITKETVKDAEFSEDGKTFTCTVEAGNIEAVFGEGQEIGSDVSVVIKTNGTQVTAVELFWQVAETDTTPALNVTVKTVYSYDLEVISLQK